MLKVLRLIFTFYAGSDGCGRKCAGYDFRYQR